MGEMRKSRSRGGAGEGEGAGLKEGGK